MLLTRSKDAESRRQYAMQPIADNWSRNVLNIQIEARLLEREGRAITNFEANLPAPQSDRAHNSLKSLLSKSMMLPTTAKSLLTERT